jgi:hypothetical protein
MRLFVPHVLYTVWCLSKSYRHNKCRKQLVEKKEENKNTTAQIGTNVWAHGQCRTAGSVSLHPEGPATSQLDQGFPWFSLIPQQMLSWYPNSTLHCMLPMQLS